jgi:hypothetical protein
MRKANTGIRGRLLPLRKATSPKPDHVTAAADYVEPLLQSRFQLASRLFRKQPPLSLDWAQRIHDQWRVIDNQAGPRLMSMGMREPGQATEMRRAVPNLEMWPREALKRRAVPELRSALQQSPPNVGIEAAKLLDETDDVDRWVTAFLEVLARVED